MKSGEADAASVASALDFIGLRVGQDAGETSFDITLLARRQEAVARKDWDEADRIRNLLAAQGIRLRDVRDPATGERRTEWERINA